MKAFASKEGRIRLMNPELNAQRMQRGADALLMPRVPQEMFVAGTPSRPPPPAPRRSVPSPL
jgi:branched-subunit amino acid aminotransferase/4-amino-4-deoxychorismate lyase